MVSQAYVTLAKLAGHPRLSEETRRLLMATLVALDKEIESRPLRQPALVDCEPTEPGEPHFDFEDEPTRQSDSPRGAQDPDTIRMSIG